MCAYVREATCRLLFTHDRSDLTSYCNAANTVLEGAYEGCSIAVNGVCLTVTKFDKKTFTVGVAPETLRLTNLGDLKSGSPVNLERAAAIDGRNSGHMVQGHVDNVGIILDKWADNESLFIKVFLAYTLLVLYCFTDAFLMFADALMLY